MKKITLIVLAAAASLFAQDADQTAPAAPAAPAAPEALSCRASFDAVKTQSGDAATDRMYALVEARIQTLESAPKDKRSSPQFQTELKTCDLSVELFKAQLTRADLTKKITAVQKEISLVKDSLITLWTKTAEHLNSALGNSRSLLEQSKRALAEKDSMLAAHKAEAQKKLDAMNSKAISVYRDARGTILSMSDILFETGKATLKQELKENLAAIGAILQSLLTESEVIVEGHTDNVGSADYNQKLSEQRAAAVMQYLIERGIEATRLESVGYGLTKPVADNGTEEGRAKNRRVELVIKDK
jgi:outer membrane protein OmpA-like peptidoglycan-associated protein